jgi:hypothetical protein
MDLKSNKIFAVYSQSEENILMKTVPTDVSSNTNLATGVSSVSFNFGFRNIHFEDQIDGVASDSTELEKHFFENVSTFDSGKEVYEPGDYKKHVFLIERAANIIAKKTRRGRGNNLMLSKEMHDNIKEMIDIIDGARFTMHIRDWIPNNEILIYYKSALHSSDSPGFVREEDNTFVINSFDYGIKLVF